MCVPPRAVPALLTLALIGSTLTAPDPARAARPMVTDDARIVDDGACQLESWVRRYRAGGTEAWALPGCNPFGFAEFTLGGAVLRPEDPPRATVLQAQVKTVLRALRPNDWGAGLAFGTLDTLPGALVDGKANPYAYAPVSASFLDDRLLTHANLGVTRVRDANRSTALTWGLGLEWTLTPRLLAVAETFGQQGERAQVHAGLRIWAVPDRVQFDAAVGRQGGADGAGTWLSIGLRLLSPPLLR